MLKLLSDMATVATVLNILSGCRYDVEDYTHLKQDEDTSLNTKKTNTIINNKKTSCRKSEARKKTLTMQMQDASGEYSD